MSTKNYITNIFKYFIKFNCFFSHFYKNIYYRKFLVSCILLVSFISLTFSQKKFRKLNNNLILYYHINVANILYIKTSRANFIYLARNSILFNIDFPNKINKNMRAR